MGRHDNSRWDTFAWEQPYKASAIIGTVSAEYLDRVHFALMSRGVCPSESLRAGEPACGGRMILMAEMRFCVGGYQPTPEEWLQQDVQRIERFAVCAKCSWGWQLSGHRPPTGTDAELKIAWCGDLHERVWKDINSADLQNLETGEMMRYGVPLSQLGHYSRASDKGEGSW